MTISIIQYDHEITKRKYKSSGSVSKVPEKKRRQNPKSPRASNSSHSTLALASSNPSNPSKAVQKAADNPVFQVQAQNIEQQSPEKPHNLFHRPEFGGRKVTGPNRVDPNSEADLERWQKNIGQDINF